MKKILWLALLFVAQAQAAEVWTRTATEGQGLTFNRYPVTMRYGDIGTNIWVIKTFTGPPPAGTAYGCNNETFTDPLIGTQKACWEKVVYDGFACLPDVVLPAKVKTVAVPPEQWSGYSNVSAWTCALPSGDYKNERSIWNLDEIRVFLEQAIRKQFDEAGAKEWCKTHCEPMGPDLTGRASTLMDAYAAKAKVTASGTATSRPVYPLNADGTRNTTAVVGQRVKVGDSCDIGARVGTTTYYSVKGLPNMDTKKTPAILGDVYAACTFSAPIGVNE
jgi:hypothetical protein